MEQITNSTAKEVWVSSNPRQVVIVGEDYDLACKLSHEFNGNVYSMESIAGFEHMISYLKCVYKNGQVIDPPQMFTPPETLEEFLSMIKCDKAYKDGDTLCVVMGDSLFSETIVRSILRKKFHLVAEFSEVRGELIWENMELKNKLKDRFMEYGIEDVYVLEPLPNPKILVVNAGELDVSDLLPNTSVVCLDKNNKDVLDSCIHLYSKGKFIYES